VAVNNPSDNKGMLRQLILVRFKVIQRAAVMYTRVPKRIWIYLSIDRLVKGTLSLMVALTNRNPFPPALGVISSLLESHGCDSSQLGINIGLQRENNISGSKVSPACKLPL